MTESPVAPTADRGQGQVVFEDADYRLAVVDLLGAIAYGELSAFERLVDDAKLAPSLRDQVEMCGMASLEFAHVARLHERLVQLGVDVTLVHRGQGEIGSIAERAEPTPGKTARSAAATSSTSSAPSRRMAISTDRMFPAR